MLDEQHDVELTWIAALQLVQFIKHETYKLIKLLECSIANFSVWWPQNETRIIMVLAVDVLISTKQHICYYYYFSF